MVHNIFYNSKISKIDNNFTKGHFQYAALSQLHRNLWMYNGINALHLLLFIFQSIIRINIR